MESYLKATSYFPRKYHQERINNEVVAKRISDGLNSAAREKINEAIEEFHQKTCIKFVPKRKKDKDYVQFVPHHDSCKVNYIGKKRSGGRQNVYLTPICQRNKGDIQHELMHVLGNEFLSSEFVLFIFF